MNIYDKLKLTHKRTRINNIPDSLQKELPICNEHPEKPIDIIIDTITTADELTPIAKSFLSESNVNNMMLYILYPKKNKSNPTTALNRDILMEKIQALGLKAVKLISANDDYSCMGFKSISVVEANKAKRPSQCVNDYLDKIGSLKEALSLNQAALQFYNGLTLGYQKDWARYIYSAVKIETQQNRFEQMCHAFERGCKSIDHYKVMLKQQ